VKSRFKYQKRSEGDAKERREQQGGDFDSFMKPGIKFFKVPEGENTIRFLPPTWENSKHFGIDIYVHYEVGGRGSYLCRERHGKGRCPICDEAKRAQRTGKDEDYIKKLRPMQKVLVYVIDRNREKEGPMVWTLGWSTDKDISAQAYNKKTNETLFIDDPESGYDVDFTRTGTKKNTRYTGWVVSREETQLSSEPGRAARWLEKITEFPLPSMLKFYKEEHIAQVFGGKRDKDDEDAEGDEDEKPRRGKHDDAEDEEDEDVKDRAAKRRAAADEDEDDEDEKPRPKKPSRDEDDEDEDEKPRPKKPSRDEDDEDDEDEKPRRKKPSRDEDDEDEDEKPRPKKPSRDEDDEDDD